MDLAAVTGTGVGGKVMKADVQKAAGASTGQAGPAADAGSVDKKILLLYHIRACARSLAINLPRVNLLRLICILQMQWIRPI